MPTFEYIDKDTAISILNSHKWYPMIHPTDLEMETSKLLNRCIELMVKEIEEH